MEHRPAWDRSLVLAALAARAQCKSSIPEIINAEDLIRSMECGIDGFALIERLCDLGFLREVTRERTPPTPPQYRTFTWIGP